MAYDSSLAESRLADNPAPPLLDALLFADTLSLVIRYFEGKSYGEMAAFAECIAEDVNLSPDDRARLQTHLNLAEVLDGQTLVDARRRLREGDGL
jgi:hypothetical protein